MTCPYCGSDRLTTVQRRTGLLLQLCLDCRRRFSPATDATTPQSDEPPRPEPSRRRRKAA